MANETLDATPQAGTSPELPSLDVREFRNALGQFATGVCLIGAAPTGFAPFAMTVNSFASVSLEPALVLWSLQKSSNCCEAFAKTENFSVNVLTQDQQDICNRYASKNDHQLALEHYQMGLTGSPVLRGALVTFECEVWARYPGGDHIIMVGEVVKMHSQPGEQPLLFHGGKYRQIR